MPIADYTTVANAVESRVWSKQQSLSCHSVVVRRRLCGYAVEQFSDDEYECDYENHPVIIFFIFSRFSIIALNVFDLMPVYLR